HHGHASSPRNAWRPAKTAHRLRSILDQIQDHILDRILDLILDQILDRGQGADAARSATVLPVTGSTRSGAISASGSSTKRRSRKRGCGTMSPGSSIIWSPKR